MFKLFVVFLSCLAMVGCSSMQAVQRPAPDSIARLVHKGDQVRIALLDGQRYELTVVSVNAEVLSGRDQHKHDQAFALREIQTLEISKTDGVKTAGAVGGVLLAVLVTGALAFAYLMSQVFDSSSSHGDGERAG